MKDPPEIRVSPVSSASKRSELLQDINKLVLPKIFNTIKTHRRNSTSSAVRRRNGRRLSVKRENCLRLPGKNFAFCFALFCFVLCQLLCTFVFELDPITIHERGREYNLDITFRTKYLV